MQLANYAFRRARKLVRYGRFGANLLAGSAFIGACHRFPKWSNIDTMALNDYEFFRYWGNDLAYSLNSDIKVVGKALAGPCLYVSNHISWLDTVILNRLTPVSFIARYDLEHWPLLGTFTQRMECVYIDRSNKFQAYRSIPRIEERLNSGRSVQLFPESTTSDGFALLPFYSMFYEAAVRTGVPVQPICISYMDGDGRRVDDPAFINNDTFFDTLSRIMEMDKVYVKIEYLQELSSKELNRKELCQRSFQMISEAHKKTC